MGLTKVVAYVSPSGQTIRVTPKQERIMTAAGYWPRDSRGAEYCTVSRGLHWGSPTYTDTQVQEMAGEMSRVGG